MGIYYKAETSKAAAASTTVMMIEPPPCPATALISYGEMGGQMILLHYSDQKEVKRVIVVGLLLPQFITILPLLQMQLQTLI